MVNLTQGSNVFKVHGKNRAGTWGPIYTFQINLDTELPIISNLNILPLTGFDEIKSSHTGFIVDIGDIYDGLSGVKITTISWGRDGVVYLNSVEFEGIKLRYTFENVDIKPGKIYVKVEVEDNAGNIAEETIQRDVIYDGPFDYSGHIAKWSNLTGQER